MLGVPAAVSLDPGDEYVGWAVGGEWRRQREDRGEPAVTDRGESLVLAHLVLAGERSGPEIGGTDDVRLLPRRAAISRVGEPDVAAERAVAGPVVA